jgi:ABC transporter ATM
MVFRAIAFTAVPTVIELVMVVTILARTFSPWVGALVLLTFAAYITFSVVLTQVSHAPHPHPCLLFVLTDGCSMV